jgi:cytochrome c oxidase assembly factor CtaG
MRQGLNGRGRMSWLVAEGVTDFLSTTTVNFGQLAIAISIAYAMLRFQYGHYGQCCKANSLGKWRGIN